MATDKAPYRMTIALKSARPDAIAEALAELKRACGEYDQAGEAAATLTLESYKEAPLRAVYEMFEIWLYKYKIGITCEVKIAQPGVRPETIAALKSTKTTPMDQTDWDNEEEEEEGEGEAEERGPIIIGPPLALPPPGLQVVELDQVEDGQFRVVEPGAIDWASEQDRVVAEAILEHPELQAPVGSSEAK